MPVLFILFQQKMIIKMNSKKKIINDKTLFILRSFGQGIVKKASNVSKVEFNCLQVTTNTDTITATVTEK